MGTRRPSRRAPGAALLALWLSGCAVFADENRRTLNALDAHAAPSSAAGRWALAPLAFPASLVALAADAVLVHPIGSLDDAWADTVDLLWTSRGETRFRRAVLLPLAVVATPPVFAGDLGGRILFPIGPNEDPEP